jgi:CrcB protein
MASKTRLSHLPLGTFSVNIIGSFLFGLVYILAQKKLSVGADVRLIMLTGFMGAFTTFSTFTFDTAKMLQSSQWGLAFGNVAGQVILGLCALGLGVAVGKAF